MCGSNGSRSSSSSVFLGKCISSSSSFSKYIYFLCINIVFSFFYINIISSVSSIYLYLECLVPLLGLTSKMFSCSSACPFHTHSLEFILFQSHNLTQPFQRSTVHPLKHSMIYLLRCYTHAQVVLLLCSLHSLLAAYLLLLCCVIPPHCCGVSMAMSKAFFLYYLFG